MLEGKYKHLEIEKKWQDKWENDNTYAFEDYSNKEIYSIDTPPPTVNGKIHMGHLSSYIHIETIARHNRMNGKNVYFPFGYDDNGLPTERYVEKKYNKKAYTLDRKEFIDMCLDTTNELEHEFHALYKSAGFSCDMNTFYSTISPESQKISQKSFIDLYKKGKVYHDEAPALWCTECRTATAQSELENKDIDSTFNFIKFFVANSKDYVVVATTRPEMLSACVCVFINPTDEKNLHLLNKKLVVPYYNFEVPVFADELVDKEKGSGVVMCCTFGDTVDKEWQRKHKLPIKECFNNAGRMNDIAGKFAGMKIVDARLGIIEVLKNADLLIKQENITHAVSVHDRCGTPIEIAVKKQWFIDVLSEKQRLHDAGEQLNWYPQTMKSRYLNWVDNLQWNWCISRQRYYGVPFPVWYCKDCGEIIVAKEEDLPVNPLTDKPNCVCTKCKGTNFEPEVDVMDTWATSSLTPQISTNLKFKNGLSDKNIPMSLRPNAHDNIRVWDFYTIVKSLYHFDTLPWKDLMISGFVTSNDGSKLAKSKGNNKNSPQEIIATYSADATRYWADSMALGKDTAFNLDTFSSGNKIINKLWNGSKFVLMFLENYTPKQIELLPMDKWVIEKFDTVNKLAINSLNKYEIAFSLNEIDKFMWNFCDNYIEIVKNRLYKPEIYGEHAKESAQFASYYCLQGLLKLYSIYLPHITEEIYMSYFAEKENKTSLHLSGYYKTKTNIDESLIKNGNEVVDIVSNIRQFKSENKISLKTAIKSLVVYTENVEFIKSVSSDIMAVGNIKELIINKGPSKLEFGEIIEE